MRPPGNRDLGKRSIQLRLYVIFMQTRSALAWFDI